MRKELMLAFAAGAIVAGGIVAAAQPAPPPPGGMRPPAEMMEGPRREAMAGRMAGHGGWRGGMMRRMREFALIYPARDRALSGPDVQKIAEAFLLFNGNHTWKVTEVSEQPDRVLFTFATADGGAIAHFAMDRHTARPERLS